MQYKRTVFLGLAIAILCLAGLGAIQTKTVSSNPLKLTVDSVKSDYKLGEPVELSFTLTNTSEKDIPLACFGLGTGELQLFISKNKKNFFEYKAEWGNVDAECHNVLKPEGQLQIPGVKILWNHKIEDSDKINPNVIKRAREGKIVNDYAFSEAGTYFVKASAFNNELSSEAIKINISEPTGEDLEVWNKIKDRGDIAYFIQNGYVQIPDYKPEEKAKFQTEIEELVEQYPNSFLAEEIEQSLAKFQANEVKRKAYLEKMNKPE